MSYLQDLYIKSIKKIFTTEMVIKIASSLYQSEIVLRVMVQVNRVPIRSELGGYILSPSSTRIKRLSNLLQQEMGFKGDYGLSVFASRVSVM